MDRVDLRLAVYRAFAGTGRAPDAGALAAQLGAEASQVAAGLRREPSQAAAYLRSVGLSGSFWGL